MGIGEGGGELVKQLLEQTYDIAYPPVVAVYLTGKPRAGVGPQDVALAIIGAVFKDGFVKNKVLEFIGDGIAGLPIDFRAGIDVMTTETTCLSSIWETDETVRAFLALHGRELDYQSLRPDNSAYYDGLIRVDLSTIKPMIALPFHPSNVYEIDTLAANAGDIFRAVEKDAAQIIEGSDVKLRLLDKIDEKGRIRVDQGVIAGCAGGTFDNIMAAAAILKDGGDKQTPLSVYPGSQPVMLELARNGAVAELIAKGAVVRTAFCGPCFGAGDVPANNGLSIRHATRNFPNREGSKPANGQLAAVALMDSRSIAATIQNNGCLCSAEGVEVPQAAYHYDDAPYRARVYNGIGRAQPDAALQYGPNIVDWPEMPALGKHLLVKIVCFITDSITTTDEIIPSGETSSFRSNPVGLAEYTLSRKDPAYVGKAKAVREAAAALRAGDDVCACQILGDLAGVLEQIRLVENIEDIRKIQLGSAIFAKKPGDGSAREQAASCQRVLGGCANFANEYATKRYRSNLINWGILPFTVEGGSAFENGDYVFIPHVGCHLDTPVMGAFVVDKAGARPVQLKVPEFTELEREIMPAWGLINYNRAKGC